MKYHEIKEIKNNLRNNATPPEKILWRHIRNRQLLGRKFLRQHAIIYDSNKYEHFFFVPDFYCEAEKLAVELDGKIHDFTKERDANRDAIISDLNIRIVRIKNEELINIPAVLEKIKTYFNLEDTNPACKRKSRK